MSELTETHGDLLRKIRWAIGVFVVGLVVSGLTAFPLRWEVELLAAWAGAGEATAEELARGSGVLDGEGGVRWWLVTVREGLRDAEARYPFLAYGTDWLAFAHLVIAVAFWGPWKDPVRNKWVVEWGMICCVAVIPLAMICGPIRGIPFWWRVIDSLFGVVGLVPLILVRVWIGRLERLRAGG